MVLWQLKSLETAFLDWICRNSPLIKKKKKNPWHLQQQHYCWHRPKTLHCSRFKQPPYPANTHSQRTDGDKLWATPLFHPVFSLLAELISPWLTKSCRISTCEQPQWSAQWGVQAASSWKPGRSGGGFETMQGNKREEASVPCWCYGCFMVGLLCNMCLEEKRDSLYVCVQRLAVLSAAAGSVGSAGGGQGGGYPGFPLRWLQDSGDFSKQMWSLTTLASVWAGEVKVEVSVWSEVLRGGELLRRHK